RRGPPGWLDFIPGARGGDYPPAGRPLDCFRGEVRCEPAKDEKRKSVRASVNAATASDRGESAGRRREEKERSGFCHGGQGLAGRAEAVPRSSPPILILPWGGAGSNRAPCGGRRSSRPGGSPEPL